MAQKTIDFEQDILEPIGSLKKDVNELSDKKITKFYASNQGETHLVDSDNGKMQDMLIYGKSSQVTTTGKNLLKIKDTTQTVRGVTITSKDGILSVQGTATKTGWTFASIGTQNFEDGTYIVNYEANNNNNNKPKLLLANAAGMKVIEQNVATALSNAEIDKVCFIITEGETYNMTDVKIQLELGSSATSYEPYTGGIPSPNPDYPQEIKSVVNPVVKVCGSNLYKVDANKIAKNKFNGDIILNDDSSITFKGNVLSSYASVYEDTFYLNKGKYRLLANQYSSEQAIGAKMVIHKSSGTVYINNNSSNKSFTIEEDNVKCDFAIGFETTSSYPYAVNGTVKFALVYDGSTDVIQPYTEQTVQLPYTLNAIPVSSDGNVTIDGQQYVADYVDTDKKKILKNIYKAEIDGRDVSFIQTGEYCNISTRGMPKARILYRSQKVASKSNFYYESIFFNDNYGFIYLMKRDYAKILNDFAQNNPAYIIYVLDTPIEIDLTDEEIAAFKALATHYPVTNISVASDQLDGYTVFNYPVSMKNGWNYVKQQLGDTRNYIYDMHTQLSDAEYETAMAYVNSEYAVALTELGI